MPSPLSIRRCNLPRSCLGWLHRTCPPASTSVTRNGIRHELVFVAPAAPTGQDLPALFAGFELSDDPAGWTDRPLDG
jgi:hypothetical protein